MKSLLCPLVLLVAACASTTPPPSAPARSEPPAAQEGASTVEAAAPSSGASATRGRPGLTREQLALWNDPEFKEWFTRSYIAETDIEPGVTINETEVVAEVRELMSKDRPDAALALLAEQRGPAASAVIDYLAGNIHFDRENPASAAAAYRVAIDKHPKFRRAWQNLGLALVQLDRNGEAIEAFSTMIALGGGDALTFYQLGRAHLKAGNALAAETAFRNAMLMDGDSPIHENGLLQALYAQERFEEFVALTARMIADDPDNASLWSAQADGYLGLEQPLRAAENLEMVASLDAATFQSQVRLGTIYAREELFDLAADAYLAALAIDAEGDVGQILFPAEVMLGRGACEDARRLLEGVEAAAGARLDDSQRKKVLKLRSRIALAEGAEGEEAALLEEIVELDPLDGEALIYLGQYHQRQGDVERAIFYFEQAGDLADHEVRAKIEHARLFVGEGRFTEAIPLLKRAQALQPRDAVQAYLEQIERIAQKR